MGNRIVAYTAGTAVSGGDFDVADIPLVSPANAATINLPSQFCWLRRGATTDNYKLVLYDSNTEKTATTGYLGYANCVTITGLPQDWPSGATYKWWVQVYRGDNPDTTPYNVGVSYGDRQVTINYSAAGSQVEEGRLEFIMPEER